MIFISGSWPETCTSYKYYAEFYYNAIMVALWPQRIKWLTSNHIYINVLRLYNYKCTTQL